MAASLSPFLSNFLLFSWQLEALAILYSLEGGWEVEPLPLKGTYLLDLFLFLTPKDRHCWNQCCGSVCFWTSRIRIRHYLNASGSGSGSESFHHEEKIAKKSWFVCTLMWLLYDFLSLKNYVNVHLQKVISQKTSSGIDISPITCPIIPATEYI